MVPESTRRAGPFEGNGVTTSFPFEFKTNAKADLRIVKLALGIETDLTLDSDYNVTLNADQEVDPGGSITYPISGSPLAADEFLTVISDLTIEQQADLPNLGAFYPEVIEAALDRAVMLIGQMQEALNRTITLQASVDGVSVELPTPSANLAIGWNSAGTALANIASPGSITLTGFGDSLINAADAAAARTILGATATGSAVFTAVTAADARTALALGTAAVANTGTASGNVPVLNTVGKLAAAVQSTLFQPLSAAVAANALTFTLASGAKLEFSDGTVYVLTANITLTVPNGGNLGTTSAALSRLWVVAVKNAGTPELAVINTWNGTDVYEILPTDSITTVAVGTGSDSAHVWYSTTLRAAQAIAPVGYVEVAQTGDAWNAAPTLTQGYGHGVPLPGQVIQTRRVADGAVATTTTVMFVDDTIPPNTEGGQFLSKAITCHSALNLVEVRANLSLAHATGSTARGGVAVFQDSTANALAARVWQAGGTTSAWPVDLGWRGVVGTASASTFAVRAGPGAAGTVTFNGSSSAREMGGVMSSFLELREIMR